MSGREVALEDAYELISVRSSRAPSGADGADWHQYVIRQGDNEIRGYRQGTLVAVTADVEALVERLNDRRNLKPGRTHIVLRGRKPGQQK
jgi:hypothetical protein